MKKLHRDKLCKYCGEPSYEGVCSACYALKVALKNYMLQDIKPLNETQIKTILEDVKVEMVEARLDGSLDPWMQIGKFYMLPKKGNK